MWVTTYDKYVLITKLLLSNQYIININISYLNCFAFFMFFFSFFFFFGVLLFYVQMKSISISEIIRIGAVIGFFSCRSLLQDDRSFLDTLHLEDALDEHILIVR